MGDLAALAKFPDFPELSPNSRAVLENAVQCARDRRHHTLGTEHILWSICISSSSEGTPRVLTWIASRLGLSNADAIQHIRGELEERQLWEIGDHESPSPLPLTDALRDSLDLMNQFAGGPVQDRLKGLSFESGLVATEFVIAGILVEGTSVAADILQRLSRGKIHSDTALRLMNVDPATLQRRLDDRPWSKASWKQDRVDDKATGLSPWFPEGTALPSIGSLSPSPSATSNWLIPGHLLIGGRPGGYYNQPNEDLKCYLDVGVRTFSCLIGEFRSLQGYMLRYPAVAQQLASKMAACPRLDFLYFPIYDFETTAPTDLQAYVLELKRRLLCGEVLFIHCLGGHGRTGMVVIPLIMSLYDVDFNAAERFVNDATTAHRKADGGYRHDMPETSQQADVAMASEAYVKKKKRG